MKVDNPNRYKLFLGEDVVLAHQRCHRLHHIRKQYKNGWLDTKVDAQKKYYEENPDKKIEIQEKQKAWFSDDKNLKGFCTSLKKAWSGNDKKNIIEASKLAWKKERKPRRQFTKMKSREIINLDTGETFETIKEASQKYDVHYTSIVKVCNNDRKMAGGYRWKYVNTIKEGVA